MSTHAYIAVPVAEQPGRWQTVYVHGDGYPSYTGRVLLDHYNSTELAEALVAGGNLSVLEAESGPLPSMNVEQHDAMLERLKTHSWGAPSTRMPGLCVYYHRDRGESWTSCAPRQVDSEGLYKLSKNYTYIWHNDAWCMYDADDSLEKLSAVMKCDPE